MRDVRQETMGGGALEPVCVHGTSRRKEEESMRYSSPDLESAADYYAKS